MNKVENKGRYDSQELEGQITPFSESSFKRDLAIKNPTISNTSPRITEKGKAKLDKEVMQSIQRSSDIG